MSQFAIRRQNWRPYQNTFIRLPGDVPVSSHSTQIEANSVCERLNREAWAIINPFRIGFHLTDALSLPLPMLFDWLSERGFTPPSFDSPQTDWAEWWQLHETSWSEEEKKLVQSAFPKLKYFHFVEEQNDCLYAVGEFNWMQNVDGIYYSGESKSQMTAFRNFEIANEYLNRRLERNIHANYSFEFLYESFQINSAWTHWQLFPCLHYDPESITSVDQITLFEICSLQNFTSEPTTQQELYAVERIAIQLGEADYFDSKNINECGLTSTGTQIVAVLSDQESAIQKAWEWDYEQRMNLNPFQYSDDLRFYTSTELVGIQAVLNSISVSLPFHAGQVLLHDLNAVSQLRNWWNTHSLWMTPESRELIWDMLDQLRFYRVRKVEVR